MADEKITYYQHDECPYLIVKREGMFYFERFDLDAHEWVRDDDKFYRVCEDDDYHVIDEAEAMRITAAISSADTAEMNSDQLAELVKG